MTGRFVIRTVQQATRFVENPSPRAMGLHPQAAASLVSQVAKRFFDIHCFSEGDLVRWLGISGRTFARRKKAGLLGVAEAERLLRLVRLKAQANRVLGGAGGRAARWMVGSNKALGGLSPMNAITTEHGAAAVSTLLLQLQDGVMV